MTANAPAVWSEDSTADGLRELPERWWTELNDPAADHLVKSALSSSPSLDEALARIDEARATADSTAAWSSPRLNAMASVARAQARNTSDKLPGSTVLTTVGNLGPSLSWEIDLFGRIRHRADAAHLRVAARMDDATALRLTLLSDVVEGVVSLRACEATMAVRSADLLSRQRALEVTRERLKVGFASADDEARQAARTAAARSNAAVQQETCTRQVNALAALSGESATSIRRLIVAPTELDAPRPHAPKAAMSLPATLLLQHPAVRSAQREEQAAWEEAAAARADRLPRLDLPAVLTGQWLRVAGVSQNFSTWSIGPNVALPLIDPAIVAGVDAAGARVRRARATLRATLGDVVQDVENALALRNSAQSRAESSLEGVNASSRVWAVALVRWRAGSISDLELEDSRQQLIAAREVVITAQRDQALAWVALVKATGGSLSLEHEESERDERE